MPQDLYLFELRPLALHDLNQWCPYKMAFIQPERYLGQANYWIPMQLSVKLTVWIQINQFIPVSSSMYLPPFLRTNPNIIKAKTSHRPPPRFVFANTRVIRREFQLTFLRSPTLRRTSKSPSVVPPMKTHTHTHPS